MKPLKPEAAEELPVIVSFGTHRKADRYVAVAVKSQGLKVLATAVLEADRSRDHVLFVLQRKQFEWFSLGRSPFDA